MKCTNCDGLSKKDGKTLKGIQRYKCLSCNRRFQKRYSYKAYSPEINNQLITLIKEGVGIRGISRILSISPTTVLNRILKISRSISRPAIEYGKAYEMDEMYSYVGSKSNMICIAYAIDRQTRQIVDFNVGKRNKGTLRKVVDHLILANAQQVRTDRLSLYINLIPKAMHCVKRRGINRIERMNLTLRTHLKRLNRRTIAYSKSMIVLSAILKIYFWSKS